jgi:hypothetical protein
MSVSRTGDFLDPGETIEVVPASLVDELRGERDALRAEVATWKHEAVENADQAERAVQQCERLTARVEEAEAAMLPLADRLADRARREMAAGFLEETRFERRPRGTARAAGIVIAAYSAAAENLRQALAFYADPRSYRRDDEFTDGLLSRPVMRDGGERARSALASSPSSERAPASVEQEGGDRG